MITINAITVRLGGRTILDGATAALPPGSRVGLIGRNGAGKSTLVKVIAGQLEPDDGVGRHAARHAGSAISRRKRPRGDATPFETVLAADIERAALLDESRDLPRSRPARRDPRAADRDRRLYRARRAPRASWSGSASTRTMQHRPLDSFSGGWKMRVALAALLFSQPDLLLLDEPSNHLDLEAVLWLEDFLKSYPATIADRQPRARLPQQRRRSHPPPRRAAS